MQLSISDVNNLSSHKLISLISHNLTDAVNVKGVQRKFNFIQQQCKDWVKSRSAHQNLNHTSDVIRLVITLNKSAYGTYYKIQILPEYGGNIVYRTL